MKIAVVSSRFRLEFWVRARLECDMIINRYSKCFMEVCIGT